MLDLPSIVSQEQPGSCSIEQRLSRMEGRQGNLVPLASLEEAGLDETGLDADVSRGPN